MSKVIRTTLSLVVSIVLCSALTMAKAAGNNTDKDKNKAHHSRLTKAAFWRHHKNGDKSAKQTQAKRVRSKAAQVKSAQVKPVSAKQVTGKKEQKPEQHSSKATKSSAKKTPTANKAKPPQKTQDPKTVSLKQ
jgi:hypothetical protein